MNVEIGPWKFVILFPMRSRHFSFILRTIVCKKKKYDRCWKATKSIGNVYILNSMHIWGEKNKFTCLSTARARVPTQKSTRRIPVLEEIIISIDFRYLRKPWAIRSTLCLSIASIINSNKLFYILSNCDTRSEKKNYYPYWYKFFEPRGVVYINYNKIPV